MSFAPIDFRYSPPLSWTCLGFPDDEHKSLVRQDGSLQYGWNRVIHFGLRHAPGAPVCSQRTESAQAAVALTRLDYGFAVLRLTAFAHEEEGLRSDVVLWELQADAGLADPLVGALVVTVDETDRENLHRQLPRPSLNLRSWEPAPPRAEHSVLLRSVPAPLVVCEDYEHIGRSVFSTEPEALEPGGTLKGAVIVPLNHDAVDHMDMEWCERALAGARAFWEGYALQKSVLRVPDPAVQDMVTASARNIFQARVVKEGLPFFQVGPLVYRGLWVVDGHFITEAARYLGHDREADLAWDALLKFRREDGSITIHPHHTKETGIALATLVRMTELSGDWERLRAHWPVVRGAVDRIARMREEAAALPPDHPCRGLLPESYGDGGMGGKRPEYTTALWILAGLKQAAAAARRLGLDDAPGLRKTYEELRADFQAHAARHQARTDGGIRFLPMGMRPGQHNFGLSPDQGEGRTYPWTLMGPGVATWAFCQAIYPGEVFTPDDPLVQDLLRLNDFLDEDEGMPRETGWLPWRALWTYHASFAAHVALYAGVPDKAVEYLYAMANHAAPTRVWREEQSLQSHPQARYVGDMPHNWASAEFIRLVRNLLVFEMGEELHVFRGLPASWIVAGHPVVVECTPTRFGRVSVRLEADGQGVVEIRVVRDPEWPHPPARTVVRIPAPCGCMEVGAGEEWRPGTLDAQGGIELPDFPEVRIRYWLEAAGGALR